MDKFESYKKQLEKELSDDSKPWTKYLNMLEEKTNVPKSYIFLGKKKENYFYRLFRLHSAHKLLIYAALI
jgi:hypothetical protein